MATKWMVRRAFPGGTLAEIDKAIAEVDRGVDLTLVEGTGHAGVGSVFDASNAQVAKRLGAKAIIVSQGGIGRCIDEICLNRALFGFHHPVRRNKTVRRHKRQGLISPKQDSLCVVCIGRIVTRRLCDACE